MPQASRLPVRLMQQVLPGLSNLVQDSREPEPMSSTKRSKASNTQNTAIPTPSRVHNSRLPSGGCARPCSPRWVIALIVLTAVTMNSRILGIASFSKMSGQPAQGDKPGAFQCLGIELAARDRTMIAFFGHNSNPHVSISSP